MKPFSVVSTTDTLDVICKLFTRVDFHQMTNYDSSKLLLLLLKCIITTAAFTGYLLY